MLASLQRCEPLGWAPFFCYSGGMPLLWEGWQEPFIGCLGMQGFKDSKMFQSSKAYRWTVAVNMLPMLADKRDHKDAR